MNGIHPAREWVSINNESRELGRTPSIFVEDYWVNGSERLFEEWLYRNGFRPGWDNLLGESKTLEWLDAGILNDYYYDKKYGFQQDRDRARRGWTWGNLAVFSSKIRTIKKLVRRRNGITSTNE